MKIITLLLSLVACSCVNQPVSSARPSPKAVQFFTDYVNYDVSAPDSLPVFLSACRGDRNSLDAIFSDYERFGSGDSEAWGDVSDVLLEELGDQEFYTYTKSMSVERKIVILKWLGIPGMTLYESSATRRLYPKTATLQKDLFTAIPTAQP